VICIRVLVNSLVLALHTCSAYAVVVVVARSNDEEANSTVWRQNEITVVMTLITFFFPMMFEVLGFAEQFHPRTQLMLQLARYNSGSVKCGLKFREFQTNARIPLTFTP